MYRHKKTAIAGDTTHPSAGGLRRPAQLRARLTLVLPLLASLASCPSSSDKECRSYNETTISMKRGTDGRTSRIRDLRLCRGICEPLIDLINETHALSSEGMPAHVRLTRPPEACFWRGYRKLTAYAVQLDKSQSGRGLYFSFSADEHPFCERMAMVVHEIGHLQEGNPPAGTEVISQLNVYEQFLMAFVLFARQGESTGDLALWVGDMEQVGLADKLCQSLAAFSRADSWLQNYDRSNYLIFMKLIEHEGAFGMIRKDVTDLLMSRGDGGLDAELERYTHLFYSSYSRLSFQQLRDLVRLRYRDELLRRFGDGIAQRYLEAASTVP